MRPLPIAAAGLLLAAVACSSEAEPRAAAPVESTAAAPANAPAPAPSPPPDVPPELRAAVRAHPDDPAARRRLAIALHDAKRRNESIPEFERLVELAPDPRHLLDLALAYSSVSRIEEAAATYRRILALTPTDPIALHNLGNLELRRGDVATAIELYTRSIAARPDYLMAHYHLGEALARAERFREAYRSYEHVLGLEPANAEELELFDDALYRLASLDIKMGAHERAITFLEELLSTNPDHPRAHYALGQALLQLGREAEAQRAFDRHMELLAKQKPTGPMASGD
jgi:tetratricopeptide (TPR) repeat protein